VTTAGKPAGSASPPPWTAAPPDPRPSGPADSGRPATRRHSRPFERRKLQRIGLLTPAASIEISGGSLILRLQADDGSGLAFSLPTGSTIVRMLARDVWESSRPLPEPKPPRAPAPHDPPRRPSI
jgi:hypothetical protein